VWRLLTVAIALLGFGDLLAIWMGARRWRYVFKPGTMFLIIALAAGGLSGAGPYGALVLAGLLFSVAGDIFLVLPRNRFLAGLASFFAAHLCYIAAFGWWSLGQGAPLAREAALSASAETGGAVAGLAGLARVPDALLAAALLVAGVLFFRRLRPGVLRNGGRRMLLPVGLYIGAISLMVLAAAGTRSPAVVAGALLFYLSDAILAWNRFVRPLPRADLGVMSTYFAAQYLLANSVLLAG